MWGRFRKYFFSGLAAFLPLALTVYLLIATFNFLDGLLGKYVAPYFQREFGFYIRGIGLLLYLLLITVIGFLVTTFIDRRIYRFFENLLLKLPFFKQVYPAVKEISSFILPKDQPGFQTVVLIPYPSKGLHTLAFLTNTSAKELQEKTGKDLCNVLVPSVPNPFSGFVVLVPKEDIIFTNITIDAAIKLVVSGGVINPLPGQDEPAKSP